MAVSVQAFWNKNGMNCRADYERITEDIAPWSEVLRRNRDCINAEFTIVLRICCKETVDHNLHSYILIKFE